jgi:hypothetical protein
LRLRRLQCDAAIENEASRAVYGSPDLIMARMREAKAELKNEKPDLQKVNGLLRRLFKSIVIDVENRTITYRWISDDSQSEIDF